MYCNWKNIFSPPNWLKIIQWTKYQNLAVIQDINKHITVHITQGDFQTVYFLILTLVDHLFTYLPLALMKHVVILNLYTTDKPQLDHPSYPDPITVPSGHRLQLTCLAAGNPSPSYAWTRPARLFSFEGSVLTINSVAFEDEGQYICSVNNSVGTITVSFNVDVKGNAYKFIVMIMAVGVVLVIIITIVLFIVFNFLLRHSMYL